MSRRAASSRFGTLSVATLQQRRRDEALARQKASREEALNAIRSGLAAAARGAPEPAQEDTLSEDTTVTEARHEEGEEASSSGESMLLDRRQRTGLRSSQRRIRTHLRLDDNLRAFYAQQLMQPDWMTDVPPDLGSSWYVMARPEGQRCLLIASNGRTTSRTRSGATLHAFSAPLPQGSPATLGASGGDFCILDCIYHQPNDTYYIQDLLAWGGHVMHDCTAEFRLFWLHSKFAEGGVEAVSAQWCEAASAAAAAAAAQPPPTQQQQQQQQPHQSSGACHRLRLLAPQLCTAQGLQAAYQAPLDFTRDGLYFLHKEAHYVVGGSPSPLALLWKDPVCSRYFIDTDAQGVVAEQQQVTLLCAEGGWLVTSDEPPVPLARTDDVSPRMPAAAAGQPAMGASGSGGGVREAWGGMDVEQTEACTGAVGGGANAWVPRVPGWHSRGSASAAMPTAASSGPARSASASPRGVHMPLRPGKLARLTVGPGGVRVLEADGRSDDMEDGGGPRVVADLMHLAPVSSQRSRGRADTLSKILFQHNARRQPLTFQQLLAVADASDTSMAEQQLHHMSAAPAAAGLAGGGEQALGAASMDT